jgi:hypothetical protein
MLRGRDQCGHEPFRHRLRAGDVSFLAGALVGPEVRSPGWISTAKPSTPIRGRTAVLRFWQAIPGRYQRSTITNLSIEETSPRRFVRTARLSHTGPDSTLEYVIRQTTQVRRGRVVRQFNQTLEGASRSQGPVTGPDGGGSGRALACTDRICTRRGFMR